MSKEQHHRVLGDGRDLGRSLSSTFLGDTFSPTLNNAVLWETAAWSPLASHSHVWASLWSEGKEQQQKKWATLCTLILLHEITEPLKHLCTEAPRR